MTGPTSRPENYAFDWSALGTWAERFGYSGGALWVLVNYRTVQNRFQNKRGTRHKPRQPRFGFISFLTLDDPRPTLQHIEASRDPCTHRRVQPKAIHLMPTRSARRPRGRFDAIHLIGPAARRQAAVRTPSADTTSTATDIGPAGDHARPEPLTIDLSHERRSACRTRHSTSPPRPGRRRRWACSRSSTPRRPATA